MPGNKVQRGVPGSMPLSDTIRTPKANVKVHNTKSPTKALENESQDIPKVVAEPEAEVEPQDEVTSSYDPEEDTDEDEYDHKPLINGACGNYWIFSDEAEDLPGRPLLTDKPELVDMANLTLVPQLDKRLSSLPSEIATRIVVELKAGDNNCKRVRAIWSQERWEWTYKSNMRAHLKPFLIDAFEGCFSNRVPSHIARAPIVSEAVEEPPYFNYSCGTLCFEYDHCGTRWQDLSHYEAALREACLRVKQHNLEGLHQIKKVELYICTMDDEIDYYLHHLKATPNLKHITLIFHEHLSEIANPNIACRRAIWDQENIAELTTRYCRKGRPFIVRRVLDGQVSSFKLHVKRIEWEERRDIMKLKYDWENQDLWADGDWPLEWNRPPGYCGLDCEEEESGEEEEGEETYLSIFSYLEID